MSDFQLIRDAIARGKPISAKRAAELLAERDELLDVLATLDANPYGCPMCDSGTLRNSTKEHWPECGHARMRALLEKARE